MFGDGLTHGKAGLVEPRVAPPVLHRDHGEVRADLLLAVEQLRHLAHRQAVTDRHRPASSRRTPRAASSSAGPSIWTPPIGFGPIEHDDFDLARRRFLHHVRHRRHVGVEARADVLQIDHDGVQTVEHVGCRPLRRAVERMDRQARALVLRRRHGGVENAADAVLRAEERDELGAGHAASRSIVAAPSRARPVWLVTRPTRCAGEHLEAVRARDVDARQNGSAGGAGTAGIWVSNT